MVRLALFTTVVASVLAAFASPVPAEDATTLEKRVTHSGRGTWFDVGLGACGEYNVNSDHIVAISAARWGTGANCGQWIHITNTANGKSAYGLTRDQCPGCGVDDLDLSPSLFQELGTLDQGVLSISWHFENKAFSP
ncbi:hypothetical protein GLOTRDRAFT_133317 [Gloeophyllum trabeum ATCC 11539]|uniref:RlpA-like protein double-psi beta-barrel domain-containing protein n=1 Tax=Gloeophyllum trabeum (strain ATCC 11539 / FP-39264 / Madison 617) TaxID=670483 RepID=S7PTB8_GLOTA|nr:uncharacterized protein GLOTRDRAFT_133317 [Gloeophyllum trabeum ATCC 11539]EPQ50991.1 hypothetical protein GLOTRDRAFT_133317 [Gloeophyllum trabeum ATCC 11539]